MGQNLLFDIGFTLMILGTLLVFAVGVLLVLRQEKGARGGGIIMIGPFPIVFGSDAKTVKALVLVAVALMVGFLVMNVLLA
ncbi:MAG: DUF131 domain-containing protein [Candidatus Bathyarchaeota archaeon]|jgi:uncharacterized protein (TIGR00304 family)|nr:DUF131 domain-containing protein [Candidatus Bathyarchaeota archaeon]